MTKDITAEHVLNDLRYLTLLARSFPTVADASTEIINLEAILNMPKGTEHFLSDIHGEHQAFNHVLKNASGAIKRKVNEIFSNTLRDFEKKELCTLIYYPEQKLELIRQREKDLDDWYLITLNQLVRVCRNVSSKYTRSKVRKALPKEFSYIIQELLHESSDEPNKSAYVAIVTNAYRAALDAAKAGEPAPQWALDEVVQVSHREYCTGFFYGRENAAQRYQNSSYVRNCDVVAVVDSWKDGRLYLTQRNRFFAGDTLEIVAPGQPPVTVAAQALEKDAGEIIETANHAMMQCSIACETAFPAGSVVRKPVE